MEQYLFRYPRKIPIIKDPRNNGKKTYIQKKNVLDIMKKVRMCLYTLLFIMTISYIHKRSINTIYENTVLICVNNMLSIFKYMALITIVHSTYEFITDPSILKKNTMRGLINWWIVWLIMSLLWITMSVFN
tara:strand:+ start:2346 stop:2738 length:393 start_codon:yes stop_codon:yes gene_type:complete